MSRGTRRILNTFWYLTYWTLHSLSALLFFHFKVLLIIPFWLKCWKMLLITGFRHVLRRLRWHSFTLFPSPSLSFISPATFFFSLFGTQRSRWKGIQACKRVTSHSELQIKPSVLGFHCYATVKWPRFAIIAFFFSFFFFLLFLERLQDGRRPKWQRSVKQFQTGWAEQRDERLLTAAQSL